MLEDIEKAVTLNPKDDYALRHREHICEAGAVRFGFGGLRCLGEGQSK